MRRGISGPILAFVELCFFILLIAQNADTLPYQADGTEDTDQFLHISKKSTNTKATEASVESDPTDSEGWSKNNGGPQTRDRRDIQNWSTSISVRSFTGLREMMSDAIVFPEDDMNLSLTQVPVTQVPVCKGSTYCETVDSYPEHVVNEALKRNDSLKYLAVVDEVSDIVQRFDADNDVPLCTSTEQVVYVQAAMNKDNEWKYIANQENFKQGIRVEKCSNENAPCDMINGPGVGYKTICRQKYAHRQLVAVQSNGTLILDTFKFPSSCCCHLSFTGSSSVPRIGAFGKAEQGSNETLIATRMRK